MGNYGIQMPDGVRIEDATNSYARFIIQPLERGFGITVGNALRRVLLSSLQGTAITGLRIDGIHHEFSTIPGVADDVSDIILNLKAVRFRARDFAGGKIHLNVKGPGEWTAGMIGNATSEYTVLNPDHVIAELANDADFDVELRVETGRGYVRDVDNKREDDPIGVIAMDAAFSPIEKVRTMVRPTRVGQRVDYESLEVEVTTDGSVFPQDALSQAATILQDHVNMFIDMDFDYVVPPPVEEVDVDQQRRKDYLKQSVEELDLSVRASNCLKAANIRTIGDLVSRDVSTMLKFRNFGRKSLHELVEVLAERGLSFGMDLVDAPELDEQET